MTDDTARSASPEPAAPESAAPDAAPVTEPATVAPESTPEATEPQVESGASPPAEESRPRPAHERKRDAKHAALEMARERYRKTDEPEAEPAPEPTSTPDQTTDTEVRARDPETGRFLPATQADPVTEAAATPPPPVPDGFARIELDDGHPLREQGKSYLDVPEALERDIRTLANSPVRRKELERAEQQKARVEAENAALREKLAEQAARAEVGDPLADPKDRRLYEDIKKKYGAEQADKWRAGLEARTEQEVGERRRELIRSQEMYAAGESFRNELVARAPQEFHLWGDQIRDRMAPHLVAYAKAVDRGEIASPSVDDFFVRVRAAYLADPQVSAAVVEWRKKKDQQLRDEAAAAARAEVESEAKQREQEKLVDAARRHGGNPLGRLPRVETGIPATGTSAEPSEQPPANETPGQRRKRLRREAMDAGRQFAR